MNKRGSKWVWMGIFLIVVLIGLFLFYIIVFNPDNSYMYDDFIESGKIINPVSGLSLEEAKKEFNENYIFFLLYQLEAYNLHSPPLSLDNPRLEIELEDESYNSEIVNGLIKVYIGRIENEDAKIVTTKEEIIGMLKDKEYMRESFVSGRSRIELIAGKKTLFYKGYLNLYNKMNGKSITGNVARILKG